MRATVKYGAGDVRVENVRRRAPRGTDLALVHVARAAICGGDIWPYREMNEREAIKNLIKF
jgi:threonine dehydrogenase-like Zn-dependent dehydrogenase